MGFTPDQPKSTFEKVPYYEDSQQEKIPGRGTEKSVDQLQVEIRDFMLKLGAGNILFSPGTFDATPTTPMRYGWLMTFSLNGINGHMEIAALPLRREAPVKKDRALAQALFLVRHWLEAEIFSKVYRPGSSPLVPFLLSDGKTVTEIVAGGLIGSLPKFSSNTPRIAATNGKYDVITVQAEEV